MPVFSLYKNNGSAILKLKRPNKFLNCFAIILFLPEIRRIKMSTQWKSWARMRLFWFIKKIISSVNIMNRWLNGSWKISNMIKEIWMMLRELLNMFLLQWSLQIYKEHNSINIKTRFLEMLVQFNIIVKKII